MEPTQEYMDTGYAPMDAEHRRISELLRQVLSAVNANDVARARATSAVAFREIADHFAHEERLMAEWQYPKAPRHVEAHANFVKDATAFGAELREKGLTPGFRRWAVQRLVTWFRFHITANDVELGLYLRRRADPSVELPLAPAVTHV
jgi:hemerythrin-like metal-binding protein